MPQIDNPNDPYAAPRAPKERGGPMLRIVLIAIMLAGAGAGWAYFSSEPSESLTPPEEAAIEQPIQVADAGAASSPGTATEATSEAPAAAPPAPEPAPAPIPVTKPPPLAAPAPQ